MKKTDYELIGQSFREVRRTLGIKPYDRTDQREIVLGALVDILALTFQEHDRSYKFDNDKFYNCCGYDK